MKIQIFRNTGPQNMDSESPKYTECWLILDPNYWMRTSVTLYLKFTRGLVWKIIDWNISLKFPGDPKAKNDQ